MRCLKWTETGLPNEQGGASWGSSEPCLPSVRLTGKSGRPHPMTVQKEHQGLGSAAADSVDPRAVPPPVRPTLATDIAIATAKRCPCPPPFAPPGSTKLVAGTNPWQLKGLPLHVARPRKHCLIHFPSVHMTDWSKTKSCLHVCLRTNNSKWPIPGGIAVGRMQDSKPVYPLSLIFTQNSFETFNAGSLSPFLFLTTQCYWLDNLHRKDYFGSQFWSKVKGPHLVMAFLLAESWKGVERVCET